MMNLAGSERIAGGKLGGAPVTLNGNFVVVIRFYTIFADEAPYREQGVNLPLIFRVIMRFFAPEAVHRKNRYNVSPRNAPFLDVRSHELRMAENPVIQQDLHVVS